MDFVPSVPIDVKVQPGVVGLNNIGLLLLLLLLLVVVFYIIIC